MILKKVVNGSEGADKMVASARAWEFLCGMNFAGLAMTLILALGTCLSELSKVLSLNRNENIATIPGWLYDLKIDQDVFNHIKNYHNAMTGNYDIPKTALTFVPSSQMFMLGFGLTALAMMVACLAMRRSEKIAEMYGGSFKNYLAPSAGIVLMCVMTFGLLCLAKKAIANIDEMEVICPVLISLVVALITRCARPRKAAVVTENFDS